MARPQSPKERERGGGGTRASPPSPFSEIFFLLATWTLTKLCPRTRPGLTSVSRRRMIQPSPPFSISISNRLPRFCFFTLIPSPRLFPPQASPQLTYKLCFQVNFPGNAEFSKLRYSITPNSPPGRSSEGWQSSTLQDLRDSHQSCEGWKGEAFGAWTRWRLGTGSCKN